METFSALPAICAGNSPVPGEFPAQKPVTRSFDVFYDLRLNKQLSTKSCGWWFETLSCPLWRHCNVLGQPGRWACVQVCSSLLQVLPRPATARVASNVKKCVYLTLRIRILRSHGDKSVGARRCDCIKCVIIRNSDIEQYQSLELGHLNLTWILSHSKSRNSFFFFSNFVRFMLKRLIVHLKHPLL